MVGDAGLWLLGYTQGAELEFLGGEGYHRELWGFRLDGGLSAALMYIPGHSFQDPVGSAERAQRKLRKTCRPFHLFLMAISCSGL